MGGLRLLSLAVTALALALTKKAAVGGTRSSADGDALIDSSSSADDEVSGTRSSTDESANGGESFSIEGVGGNTSIEVSTENNGHKESKLELSRDEVYTVELMSDLKPGFTLLEKGSCKRLIYKYGRLLKDFNSTAEVDSGSVCAWFHVKAKMYHEHLIHLRYKKKTDGYLDFGFIDAISKYHTYP